MTKLSTEQLRILTDLDVNAALIRVAKSGFIPGTREAALAGLHKARLTVGQKYFTPEELELSRTWLKEKGFRYD